MLANAIWMPVLIFMAGAVVSAIRSGDDVLRQLRDRVSVTQARTAAQEAETARIRKEVASALHGTVQSQLLAAAAGMSQPRIAELMTRNPEEGLEAALASVEAATSSDVDVMERLQRIERSWGSLMQVEVRGMENAHGSNSGKAVIRIVEEGLANAYRHGRASEVTVGISREATGLRIRVVDNGSGPSDTKQTGLGSALLESLAPGAWSLTRGDGRTTVLDVLLSDSET